MLPPDTTYLCNRLQGFGTNSYRLETVGRNNGKAGSIVSFDLPSNSIVDLHSFCVNASLTTTGKGVRLPSDVRMLINRIEISCGGTNVDSSSS
eukprot:3738570-Pleurochrysis_carterae.AAC.1